MADKEIFIPAGQTYSLKVKSDETGTTITVKTGEPEILPMGGDPGDPPKED